MVEALSRVQDTDLELDAVLEERGKVPPSLTRLREQVEDLDARLVERRAERDALEKRVRAGETESQDLAQRAKDAAEAALRAGSPKEAAQYQNQELQFRTRQQELDEETFPLMEELETLREAVASLEAERGELAPQLEEQEEAERQRVAELDARAETLRAERDRLAAEVSSTWLRPYEQVRRSRGGLGLVSIRDGRQCGGCSVQLPIHVLQKAKRADAGVVRCPNCGRLLHAGGTANGQG